LETKIAAVWSKVLSLNQVSPDDNFFDLGGDSLQLLEVHAELGKALTSQLSVTDLFEYTTVRSLAARLSGSEGRNLHAAQERARQQQAVWAQQKR
jgi:acyl carrier protein